MPRLTRAVLLDLGMSLSLMASALLLTLSLESIKSRTPFMFVGAAAIVIIRRKGLFISLVSIVFASLAMFLLIRTPVQSLGLFVLLSALMAWASDSGRRAQDALRKSEARYRDIVENYPDLICVHDHEGTVLEVNRALVECLGYDRHEELVGRNISEFLPPDLRASVPAYLETAVAGSSRGLMRLLTRTGEERIIEYHNSARTDGIEGPIVRGAGRDVTDYRKIERQLRESEARLRLMIHQLPAVMWTTDEDLKFTSSLGAGLAGLDLQPNQLAGMSLFDFFPGQDSHPAISAHKRALKGEPVSYELDWSGHTFQAHVEPFADSSGRLHGCIGIAVNITERKRAETALRNKEREAQVIFDSVPAMIWYKDRENRILRANKAAADSIGMQVEAVEGKSTYDLYPEEAAGYHLDDLEVINTGIPKLGILEQLMVSPGEKRWVQTDKIPYRDDDENIIGVIAFALDITDSKEAQEALTESEARYRAVAETASDGIITCDESGVILFVNHAAERIFGYSAAEMVGQSLSDLMPEYLSHAGNGGRSQYRDNGEQQLPDRCLEVFGRHSSGGELRLEISLAEFTSHGKRYFTRVVRDVTELRRLQQQLMLSDRLASLGQLVSGVAHEINNPLSSVIGHTQLLLRSSDWTGLRDRLEIINSDSERARRIVHNLLSFARQHKPARAMIDINQILTQTLDLRSYQLQVNNIRLRQDLADLPLVEADPYQLQQVFLNLIINAEQAILSANRGGTLLLSTELKPAGASGWAVITITDDGPGIGPEEIGKVFDPFFTTKDIGQGTGLGLSVSYGIVKEHGGKIRVESLPGQGASFIVELPA